MAHRTLFSMNWKASAMITKKADSPVMAVGKSKPSKFKTAWKSVHESLLVDDQWVQFPCAAGRNVTDSCQQTESSTE